MKKASRAWRWVDLWIWLAALIIIGLSRAARPAPPGQEIKRRVNELLARMTLQEKVGQLQQLDSVPNAWRVRDEDRDLIPRG